MRLSPEAHKLLSQIHLLKGAEGRQRVLKTQDRGDRKPAREMDTVPGPNTGQPEPLPEKTR